MKLVILDRDGVINYDSDKYIKSPEEWNPIPGSLEAIARLHREGYRLVVASNQPAAGGKNARRLPGHVVVLDIADAPGAACRRPRPRRRQKIKTGNSAQDLRWSCFTATEA